MITKEKSVYCYIMEERKTVSKKKKQKHLTEVRRDRGKEDATAIGTGDMQVPQRAGRKCFSSQELWLERTDVGEWDEPVA